MSAVTARTVLPSEIVGGDDSAFFIAGLLVEH